MDTANAETTARRLERLCAGGWRAFYEVDPDTGRDDTAGDVRVLRVYRPGEDRSAFSR